MRIISSVFGIAYLVLISGCGSASPERAPVPSVEHYAIVFDRPVAVGERFRVDAQAVFVRNTVTRIHGTRTNETRLHDTTRLVGEVEVLKVEEGHATRLQITVHQLTRKNLHRDDNRVVSLLPAGSVLYDSPRVLTLGASEDAAPVEVVQALASIHYRSMFATDQDGFGTDDPRTVGEEWPLRMTSDQAGERDGEPDGDTWEGRVRLLRQETRADVRSLVLRVERERETDRVRACRLGFSRSCSRCSPHVEARPRPPLK